MNKLQLEYERILHFKEMIETLQNRYLFILDAIPDNDDFNGDLYSRVHHAFAGNDQLLVLVNKQLTAYEQEINKLTEGER